MGEGVIGIAVHNPNPVETLAAIRRADELGIKAAWLTTGSPGPDALTLFGAAAVQTERILLGTSIVPTFPRHPLVMVQQALVVGHLAPGRLRLGVGPSHKPTIETTFGIAFERPVEHLREYVAILKAALGPGSVDFEGKRFSVHAKVAQPVEVPVMISALRGTSFRVAGEIADGAISWICPTPHLAQVAVPALREGAAAAGRPTPPLVAHAWVAASTDKAAVYAAARQYVSHYPKMPFYANMFAEAGYPEALDGTLSDAMIDAVVIHGGDQAVVDGLRARVAAGATEVIGSLLPVGPDRRPVEDRTMRVIAEM
ncbi:MAG: LLM class flavin-dependent oxidoreductase [Chloroflexi bacterium]|nr:LLM class flavin-dependent oxidoreductase [Chloroflexota bacterium]